MLDYLASIQSWFSFEQWGIHRAVGLARVSPWVVSYCQGRQGSVRALCRTQPVKNHSSRLQEFQEYSCLYTLIYDFKNNIKLLSVMPWVFIIVYLIGKRSMAQNSFQSSVYWPQMCCSKEWLVSHLYIAWKVNDKANPTSLLHIKQSKLAFRDLMSVTSAP